MWHSTRWACLQNNLSEIGLEPFAFLNLALSVGVIFDRVTAEKTAAYRALYV